MKTINLTPRNLTNTLSAIKKEIETKFGCNVKNSEIRVDICNGYLNVRHENDVFIVDYEVITSNGGYFYHQSDGVWFD